MFRRIGVALATGGLLVTMIPATVSASTWQLAVSPVSMNCTGYTSSVTVSWSGGHGQWINYRVAAALFLNGNSTAAATSLATYRHTNASAGSATVPAIGWSDYSGATSVVVDVSVQLLNGGINKTVGTAVAAIPGICP